MTTTQKSGTLASAAEESKFTPYTVLSFIDNQAGGVDSSFKPKSVQRHSDGEIFTIGDRVTNGTAMAGIIKRFDLLDGTIYVLTSWSGVGMGLEDIKKLPTLPTKHQYGDHVCINLEGYLEVKSATVIKIHYTNVKEQYDISVYIGKSKYVRLYNIDKDILDKYVS